MLKRNVKTKGISTFWLYNYFSFTKINIKKLFCWKKLWKRKDFPLFDFNLKEQKGKNSFVWKNRENARGFQFFHEFLLQKFMKKKKKLRKISYIYIFFDWKIWIFARKNLFLKFLLKIFADKIRTLHCIFDILAAKSQVLKI